MAKHHTSRAATIASLAAIVLGVLFYFQPSASHAIHKGAGDLVCGNCHTMHNSQGSTSIGDGNAPLGGNAGGSLVLLRGPVANSSQISKFCLQCHGVGGAFAEINHVPHGEKAPKVYGGGSLNWDETKDFGKIGAGGDFFMELDSSFDLSADGAQPALGYGHSVGATSMLPPGTTDFQLVELTCVTCHSPHGADAYPGTDVTKPNFYRNLWVMKAKPDWSDCLLCHDAPDDFRGSGYLNEMKSYVGGVTGTFGAGGNYAPVVVNGVAVWPVFKDDSTVPANNNVYDGILGAGDSPDGGMGGWCARCHHAWHEVRVTANVSGEDWKRHPASYLMKDSDVSGAGVDTIDWSHYSTTPAGFKLPLAYSGAVAGINSNFYYADTDNEYKVFCLTCHFAHAGPYKDGLRWDYLIASSVAMGSQSGNSIGSNKGCQLCHNR